jgi:hypothetical protein
VAALAAPLKDVTNSSIILHSGSTRAELEQLAQRCGAAGVIQKTGDPVEFMRQFEQFVSLNRRDRTTRRRRI